MQRDLKSMLEQGRVLLQSERMDEAEALFRDLTETFPKAVQGYVGLARVAQRRRDWERALRRWEAVLEKAPHHLHARTQHANMLLQVGDIGRAEACFRELAADAPDAIQAHAGLMRAARIRADWPALLRAARVVSSRCEASDRLFAQAAHAVVLALVRLNRFDEAREEAERLQNTSLPEEDGFLLTATVLQEQQDWTETLAWYRKHEATVLADPRLLLRYLNVVLRCGFPSRARDLLMRFLRANPHPQIHHRLGCISILERIGEEDLAARWLSLLVTTEGPEVLDRNLFVLLVTNLLQKRQLDRLRSLLREIETVPFVSSKSVNLKCAAIFYRALADHLHEHRAIANRDTPAQGTPQDVPIWDRIAEQNRSQPAPHGHHRTRDAMDRFVRFYRELEENRPQAGLYLNTFCQPRECYGLVDVLLDRIRCRRPTSLIRLGDCEGIFLPYPASFPDQQATDQEAIGLHWWGRKLDARESDGIRRELILAMEAADVIGIPEPARVFLDLPVPTPPDLSTLARHWRGMLNVFHHLSPSASREGTIRFRPDVITASYVNLDLELWGGYDPILQAARSCSVVCSHPDIAGALQRRFNREVCQVVLIPAEEKYQHRSPGGVHQSHYPAVFEELRRTLTVREPGELFLVAAGILGKSYCAWIKQRGGIALDVGSMIDLWCGFRTRRDVMHARISLGRAIRQQARENAG